MDSKSKKLRQGIELILDAMAMDGPIIVREVVERICREIPDDHWAEGDRVIARLDYLTALVATSMKRANSQATTQAILDSCRLPQQYADTVMRLPRFICISKRGGAGAKHVLAFKATAADWEANLALKEFVTEHARRSSQTSRDLRDLLRATGARNLEALTRVAAE